MLKQLEWFGELFSFSCEVFVYFIFPWMLIFSEYLPTYNIPNWLIVLYSWLLPID